MYIKVLVVPSAKEESLKQVSFDSFEISVREKPERNMANKRVLEVLKTRFAGKRTIVKIVSGHISRSKIFSVDVIKSVLD